MSKSRYIKVTYCNMCPYSAFIPFGCLEAECRYKVNVRPYPKIDLQSQDIPDICPLPLLKEENN